MLKDADGNKLQTDLVTGEITFFLVVLSADEKAAAGSQSSASLLTLLLTFGTSTFISVALGGTVEATWLLFGTIQLMSLVPLLNLNLPANFREFSKNLAVLHGEPAAIPNLFTNVIETKGLEPYNDYFLLMSKRKFDKFIDFETTKLLMNSARKIEIWAMMFSFMGVTFLLFDILSETSRLYSYFIYFNIAAKL